MVLLPEAIRTSLLMSAAEIGDKTFFVTMLLSMRYRGVEEKGLVFVGSLLGVILTALFTILVTSQSLPFLPMAAPSYGSRSALDLVGFALFMVLGLRMAYESQREEEEEDSIRLPASTADFDTNPYAPYLEDTNPFSNDLIAEHPNPFAKDAERYPSYGGCSKLHEGRLKVGGEESLERGPIELLLHRACVSGLAFCCALVGEVGDKSAAVLMELQTMGHHKAWTTALGTLLAFTLLSGLAVIFGFLLQQRYAAGGRALLLAALISFVLALISLSEGLTALPATRQWVGFLQRSRL